MYKAAVYAVEHGCRVSCAALWSALSVGPPHASEALHPLIGQLRWASVRLTTGTATRQNPPRWKQTNELCGLAQSLQQPRLTPVHAVHSDDIGLPNIVFTVDLRNHALMCSHAPSQVRSESNVVDAYDT
jgi:hypothetical protein